MPKRKSNAALRRELSAYKRRNNRGHGGAYKGSGDYKKVLRNIGHWGLRGLGGAYGAYTGRSLKAAQAGWKRGAAASKFLGSGDYVASNQIVDGGKMSSQQNIAVNQHDLTGDIYISKTEFVRNVTASVADGPGTSKFEVSSFSLNPGLSDVFPWLSQIAQNFELYELDALMFQYKPSSGEFGNSSSNTLGKVIMCTNYDPASSAFSNSVEMENYDYACSVKPSHGCVHGVECANRQRATSQMYVRTSDVNRDLIFTDLGKFQIATEGIPFSGSGEQSSLIGELWVSYTIKLSRAKLYAALGESIQYSVGNFTTGENTITLPSSDFENGLGLTPSIFLPVSGRAKLLLTFPIGTIGRFMVMFNCALNDQAQGTVGIDVQGSAELINYYQQADYGNAVNFLAYAVVQINDPSVTGSIQLGRSVNLEPGTFQVTVSRVDQDLSLDYIAGGLF